MFKLFKNKEINQTQERMKHIFGYLILSSDEKLKLEKNKKIITKNKVPIYPSFIFNHYYENLIDINLQMKVFKVESSIKQIEYLNIVKINGFDNKNIFPFGANEFRIIKELTFDDLKIKYLNRYKPLIETEKEYNNCNNYESFARNKFFNKMKVIGFKESFINITFETLNRKNINILNYLNRMEAYKEEDISKDELIELATRY